MSLDALIMLAGALIALIPFLGFTVVMQMWIFFLIGIIIIGLGIAVRRRGMPVQRERKRKRDRLDSTPTSAAASLVSYDIESNTDNHHQDENVT